MGLGRKTRVPIVIIAGATASGKSALSLEIARRQKAAIINADSLQLYGDLPLLTAFPSREDFLEVPHWLYGSLSLEQKATAVWWRDQALGLIDQVSQKGCIPIIVGGTGFYLETLLRGISPIPPVDSFVFESEKKRLTMNGSSALWESLNRVDPTSACRIHPKDSQRVLRAWTVWCSSGKSLSFWQMHREAGLEDDGRFLCRSVFLNPSKTLLKEKIDQRLAHMRQEGVIEEVQNFLERCQGRSTPLHKAVGVKEIEQYLTHQWSYEETFSQISRQTVLLAKRQVTWFKHRLRASVTSSVDSYESFQILATQIIKMVQTGHD